eukprot:TRINITY_DN23949_c0_g1_i1.p1 TRINITY_DN23949_c0_g1~~TRINITY_DN23949_c0_g1_i1.p1  ORF type:complete len:166 (+),score=22.69 TRINITY_DN23949_c0_g1_i1:57-554(+)
MKMLKVVNNLILMEGAVKIQLFSNGVQNLYCKQIWRHHTQTPFFILRPESIAAHTSSLAYVKLPKIARHEKHPVEVHAIRRRRADIQTDTYVLMEPGKSEEFVSLDELKDRLKGWLQNWPGNALPTDLARFKTIDDAISHLVKSVCELEIDGEVGSIQWYEVRVD